MKPGRGLPRAVEALIAAGALVALSPILGLIGAAVLLTMGRPVLFRHTRVGRFGRPFVLLKFRTMVNNASGPAVTAGDDPRITRVGRLLRRTKLDELPELWNVLTGDMSFVGPRPEAPKYVRESEPRWREVLQARPGLTDPTTLSLLDEETLLAGVEGDREAYYLDVLLPRKLDSYLEYLQRRTWRTDLDVIGRTARSLASRAK